MSIRNDVSFLAFSCVHAPLHDPQAIDQTVELIAKERPDVVIHLGDGMEMSWASRFEDAGEVDALSEYKSHNDILKQFRKASPKSRRIFLPGNHEWRLHSPRIEPSIRAALAWRIHQPEMQYWEEPCPYLHCRHRGVFRLGQVVFCHGHACSVSGVKREVTTMAREWGLYVHGHTHRPTPPGMAERLMATATWPLNWWRANPGCLRDLSPEYMSGQDKTLWGHGAVVGRAQITKSPRLRRCLESRTVIFRMYDDWANSSAAHQMAVSSG